MVIKHIHSLFGNPTTDSICYFNALSSFKVSLHTTTPMFSVTSGNDCYHTHVAHSFDLNVYPAITTLALPKYPVLPSIIPVYVTLVCIV